jgi:antitoxin HigA-1
MHPGKIIAKIITSKEGCNLSVNEAAEQLKVHKATLYRLLGGKASLSIDMAVRLSKLLPQIGVEVWMNLQRDYDISTSKKCFTNIQIKPLQIVNFDNIKTIFKKYKITN